MIKIVKTDNVETLVKVEFEITVIAKEYEQLKEELEALIEKYRI